MKRSFWCEVEKMEKVHESLAMWVCCEDVPARASSDDPNFKQFLRALNPDFWPCFETLEHNCLKIYAGEKEKVKEGLSKISGHVSLSVDFHVLEEHEFSKDYYVFMSAHFIDDDWKLQKWVIKFCGVGYGENKDVPSEAILKSLREWDIESKVFTMTALASKNTVDKVKEQIHERRKLPMDGQLFHVRCCSHIISQMMLIGFREIKSIIDKVKQLSWSKSDPIWYLISFKLEQALELEAMGEFSSELVKKNYEVPSSEEWGKVRVMCRIANRIHEIVEGLFKVKNPTTNLFLPHLLDIRSYLVLESNSNDDFVKAVAMKMLKFFDEYWKDAYLVLAIAAFMDPRYKMKFIEFSFSDTEIGDGQLNPASILETIRGLHDNYVVRDNQREHLRCDSSSDSDKKEEDEEGYDGHFETRCIDLLGRLSVLSSYDRSVQSTNNQAYKSDLDLYLEEPVFSWNEKFDVLQWWKHNCSKFPHLSRMARDFLGIPMSLATSDDAYSTVPRNADRSLVSLKPELMNALKCTRSWKIESKKGTEN